MAAKRQNPYELKEVVLRLAEGQSLYSDQVISNADAAVEVMRKELMQEDRERLVVINLNSKMKAINYNVVSVGSLTQTVADIPFIMKSAICSNAASTILLHTHPSGDPTPSGLDVELTKRVVEAGKLIGISCADHVIVGCGTGFTFSMREQGIVDFDSTYRGVAAEDIINVAEETGDYQGKERNMENRTENKMEEISIKFGKGLAEPFTGKDGKEYMRILIPNEDKGDHTPWASFVLPAKAVHENKYGKGLWAKIPADGTTTVTKAVQVGEQDGKRIWENQKTTVPNRDLKARVEAYKSRDRESARGKLEQLTAQVAEKLSPSSDRPRARATGMEK